MPQSSSARRDSQPSHPPKVAGLPPPIAAGGEPPEDEEASWEFEYLDIGEIVFTEDDSLAAALQENVSEETGMAMATAPELLRSVNELLIVVHELQRNYIATLQGEYHDMIERARITAARAQGDL